MKIKLLGLSLIAITAVFASSCGGGSNSNNQNDSTKVSEMKEKVNKYATVKLSTDIKHLSEKEKQILVHLFDAAKIMDELFWLQNFGNKQAVLDTIKDADAKRFFEINYGPWDDLDNEKPFIEGFSLKPAGANFYPADITKEEFEKLADPKKTSLYTVIRRDEKGNLKVVPYSVEYKEQLQKASDLVKKAAELAEDASLKKYLTLRAEALITDNYQPSDFAWMDMKNTNIDFVIGPIENYTDGLFGYKAAFESFILVKDLEWSKKLAHYAKLLPELQKGLPVDEKFKKEIPGADSDINVYDAVYYAGDCNSGSKTIAINLPNDEEVQLKKGTRKLQLKNAMKAKFDNILLPIANVLITDGQLKNVKFDAFFTNVMFHEVAHGMRIKNTINGKGTIREALKEQYSALEEGKADIMGLYLVTKLHEMGEIKEGELMDYYVTFLAGIFRSVRFGVSSAHGKANMVRFYYLQEMEAFTRDNNGKYSVNLEKMKQAVITSVQEIMKMQGEGDYNAAKTQVEEKGIIKTQLQADLDRLKYNNIPVDIVFEQGKANLGL